MEFLSKPNFFKFLANLDYMARARIFNPQNAQNHISCSHSDLPSISPAVSYAYPLMPSAEHSVSFEHLLASLTPQG